MNPEEILTVAVIDDVHKTDTPEGRALQRVISGLRDSGLRVEVAASPADARTTYSSLPGLDCILINWNLRGEGASAYPTPVELVREIRKRNEDIPIFLMGEPPTAPPVTLSMEMLREINEYIWVMEDTPEFIAGRIDAAARRYREGILPPFFSELVNFSRDYEYSWHTPGHTGGTAFRKSPAGRAFHSFFGGQLFRSDLSISVAELGSLLDHSGPVGAAERYAARVFGADHTYFVTNGTSTANKIVFSASVSEGDIVLVDRNSHKSVEHALILTRSIPVYLVPTRNRYGIIGPIRPCEMTPDAVQRKIESSPLLRYAQDRRPVQAVITNSTYDGLCYRAVRVEELLGGSVDRILYDEAWYGYARFNPLYRDRFGMRDGTRSSDGPTIYATQSTHKLLAALSQASMIHVRNGRAPIEHGRFNEAFMMHTSTSPLYAIIASLDVSSKMMEGASGRVLTTESIEEAIRFRRTMARIGREIARTNPGDWWFSMWQPEEVTDPVSGKKIPFADAHMETLRDNPPAWVLHPGETWHGFPDLEEDYCMLDPIKVTVLTPGVREDGSIADLGIPAVVVDKFLTSRGIITEKCGDYNILFLFSMGITKGKWGTLITEFFEFKRLFDENSLLEEVLPELVRDFPARYVGMTLPGLAAEMHGFMRDHRQATLLLSAFSRLPEPVIPGGEAYRRLVRGQVERVPVAEMGNRIVATGVVPYPPGIPLLLPGERAGERDGPVLQYLLALQEFDDHFPGFSHEIHGVREIDGRYHIYCIKEESR
jgi:lysine decarboxylase/arginine decarboxylase